MPQRPMAWPKARPGVSKAVSFQKSSRCRRAKAQTMSKPAMTRLRCAVASIWRRRSPTPIRLRLPISFKALSGPVADNAIKA